jgi:hypothetical protein
VRGTTSTGGRIGALAAAVALCAACTRAPPSPAPRSTGAPAFSSQVLELRDAALNARDVDAAAMAYAEDAVVLDAEAAAIVLRGREEIRAAHARFLAACPRARIEVLDRSYAEQGRIVTDVERVRCNWTAPVEGWVRYEVVGGAVIRVLKHRSPPFGG